MAQVRYNITLPDSLKAQLQADAEVQGIAVSKLIANYVDEHYATSDALERLDTLEQESFAMVEKLTQEKDQAAQKAVSQDTVIKGLQQELELTKTSTKNLSEQVVELKGQIRKLEDDKEFLQKQLELVTLRLPAPKEGFWSRLLGRLTKEQDWQA